jgi:hypothetical protein
VAEKMCETCHQGRCRSRPRRGQSVPPQLSAMSP